MKEYARRKNKKGNEKKNKYKIFRCECKKSKKERIKKISLRKD